MSNTSLSARCPFRRPTSASAKIYMVLAKASKPLKVEDVAKRAKVSQQQARTLVNSFKNPFHNAPLRRAGVQVTSEEGAFSLSSAKAVPNAKRPPRGNVKKAKVKKAKSVKCKAATKNRGKAPPRVKKTVAKNTKSAAVVAPAAAVAVEPAISLLEQEN